MFGFGKDENGEEGMEKYLKCVFPRLFDSQLMIRETDEIPMDLLPRLQCMMGPSPTPTPTPGPGELVSKRSRDVSSRPVGAVDVSSRGAGTVSVVPEEDVEFGVTSDIGVERASDIGSSRVERRIH